MLDRKRPKSFEHCSRERNAREEKRKAAGGSIRFYRDGVIWKNLMVIYVAWFSTLMVHFGLIRRSVRQDTGDIYTNFFLMDSTEMIAIIVSLFTINRCARKEDLHFQLVSSQHLLSLFATVWAAGPFCPSLAGSAAS